MIALDGWIEIPPDQQDHIVPLLAEHVALTRAEPGCLAFSVAKPRRSRPVRRLRAFRRPRRLRGASAPRRRVGLGRRHPPPAAALPITERTHDRPLRLGGNRPADAGLPRRGMGRARARRPRALWEKLVLDGFQAGLAWITILRKRETLRAAFAGFDPGERRPLRRGRHRPPAGRSRHHPLARQDRRHDRRRPDLLRHGRPRRGFRRPSAGPSPTARCCAATASACPRRPRCPRPCRRS